MIQGRQLVVSDSGEVQSTSLSPSVAVGDLNGDGLIDLVIADAMGFFWYFQNHGTKNSPKFTNAEVMPVWLGDPCTVDSYHDNIVPDNVVPRIQLVDYANAGKLDIVAGNYFGKLFYLHNMGTAGSPVFKMPHNLDDVTVATRHDGALWCNYAAPYFVDWNHSGTKDLLLGDGSYSANSIYLLKNAGDTSKPRFTENKTFKIIPGMGSEHLVPQVVSWNGDGKADLLVSERAGYVSIFLNQTLDSKAEVPVFDQGHHILIGGTDKLAELSTVTLADLYGDGLPGLIVAAVDGHIYYSRNIGKANDYRFAAPVPLKMGQPKAKVLVPLNWSLEGAFGSPYDLLVSTNTKVEPSFTPPDDTGINSALRFYRDIPSQLNVTFPESYYPESDKKIINCNSFFILKSDQRYQLSFWVKTDGDINELKYLIEGWQPDPANSNASLGHIKIYDTVATASSWNLYSTNINYKSLSEDRGVSTTCAFHFSFSGKGSLYIAGLKLTKSD